MEALLKQTIKQHSYLFHSVFFYICFLEVYLDPLNKGSVSRFFLQASSQNYLPR